MSILKSGSRTKTRKDDADHDQGLRKPKTRGSKLKVASRSQSNIFAMFSQNEIQEFKEVYLW